MKVSYRWLREVVNIPEDAEALARALTMVGIQLESKQPTGDDITLDFEVTVNRPDCLSVIGLSREIALIYESPAPAIDGLHKAQVLLFRSNEGRFSDGSKDVQILIEDSELCPRYCAQLITNIKVGPSPGWMQKKLEACGLRPINNVVDITNLVMMELGQPMHAFDFDTLKGGMIRVRKAQNEKLLMIDGKQRLLQENMLAIADAERAVAVAGVMGGRETEVTDSTTNILFESAYFQPASVRRTARSLELSTDASYRFERGADYKMQAIACLRAAALIEECAGGEVHPVLDVHPGKFQHVEIRLRHPRVARILGQSIDPHLADNILTALGFIKKAENLWQIPSFRVDIFKEIDLIEEIARHYGYNKVPTTLPKIDKQNQKDHPTYQLERAANQFLRGCGIDEAYTYSFTTDEMSKAPRIVNPLAETASVLRDSLLPNLKDSVHYNLRHRNENVRLFEIGRVFLANEEKTKIGIAMLADYREMKGIVENLFSALQYPQPLIRDGQIVLEGKSIGRLEQSKIDSTPLQLCELDLTDLVLLPGRNLRYQAIIPYPVVERDLSFVVKKTVTFAEFEQTLNQLNVPELRNWKLVDRYEGKNIPANKLSLTFRMTFQASDRTLTSEEADSMFGKVIEALTQRFSIDLRK